MSYPNKPYDNILSCIGNTPLIHLKQFPNNLECNLFVKCEMFNPTLSIKDRIVLQIIRDLEKKGLLKPGMTIVESSSGNTGTSLAMLGSILGYKIVITSPNKTSIEKINSMRYFGAKVFISPKNVNLTSKEHYVNKAQILAQQPGSVLLNQYSSDVNVDTHAQQTGQEVWDQMNGNIDYIVAAASSGGTITGLATFLKNKNKNIQVIMPDPVGSVFYHYFQHRNLNVEPTAYQVEGAGKDKICSIHDFDLIDDVIQFTDDQALSTAQKLAKTEGILAGESSGGALFAFEKLNPNKVKGKNVVVILADSGFKYLSKISC